MKLFDPAIILESFIKFLTERTLIRLNCVCVRSFTLGSKLLCALLTTWEKFRGFYSEASAALCSLVSPIKLSTLI
jgi:hypothetical protein